MLQRKIIYMLLLLNFICSTNYAQPQLDSLNTILKTQSKDHAIKTCDIFLNLSYELRSNNLSFSQNLNTAVLNYLNRLGDDSLKLNLYLLIIRNDVSHKESTNIKTVLITAYNLSQHIGTAVQKSKLYFYIGSFFLEQKGDYKKASLFYIESLKQASLSENQKMIAHVNTTIGILYMLENHADSGLAYFQKATFFFEICNDSNALAMNNINVGAALSYQAKYILSNEYLKKALIISKKTKNYDVEVSALYNISNNYQRNGDYALAQVECLSLIDKLNDYQLTPKMHHAKSLLAQTYFDLKEYQKAINTSTDALMLVSKQHDLPFELANLELLKSAFDSIKDYKNALKYANKLSTLKDSVSKVQSLNYLEEIKAKYNIEKKEKELIFKNNLIAEQEKTERLSKIVIVSLFFAVLVLLAFIVLFIKQRQTKNALLLKDIEQQKQLHNLESFINGQETERKRIASDLHDGIAQNLVMLNLKLNNFSFSDQKDMEAVKFLKKEVNNMINETRQIAHNMMPDVLIDLGLVKALTSLVSKVNTNSTGFKAELTISQPFYQIPSETEVQLYRMAQELINNTIKHSEATLCEISLASTITIISLIVKDNGKGINEIAEKKHGLGLNSLFSRAQSLRGTLVIENNLLQGALISISIPVNKM